MPCSAKLVSSAPCTQAFSNSSEGRREKAGRKEGRKGGREEGEGGGRPLYIDRLYRTDDAMLNFKA